LGKQHLTTLLVIATARHCDNGAKRKHEVEEIIGELREADSRIWHLFVPAARPVGGRQVGLGAADELYDRAGTHLLRARARLRRFSITGSLRL